ncbi:pyrroline-5-carboxylate reductase [Rhodobacter sp. CZR27]|uniref:pyrroline-5-carboxylate reductase family protein n=1 Tax=Rhodobacter sp. CZR27 TaxID=2033869 RepID=UPI000BBEBAA0|nr:pyrroline-5-carboxylate reductase dimerization domain-containing protein [Rhodobacter sp. CZR27]
MRIGIIGGTGWLGSALARGLLRAGTAPADLVILNRSGPQPGHFEHPVAWARDVADLVGQSDIVVVSVRPEQWPALGLRAEGRLLISFMAGVPLAALSATGGRAVRAMPNAAAEIGASYSPWLPAADVTEADRQDVSLILSAIGTSDELASEDQIDLMTAVSGSGPAYPALMALAMMEFLRERGVAEGIARRAAEATVCAAAQLLAGRIETAPDLVRTFIDYAGTTAAGLQTAGRAGFGTALQAGLAAATARAKEMSEPR